MCSDLRFAGGARVSDPRATALSPEAEPGRKGLWLGILAYRLVSFAWMSIQALAWQDNFRNGWLAWAAVGLTGVWVLVLAATRWWERPAARLIDLASAAALIVLSGLVVAERQVVGSDMPFFATGYPVSAAMTIGAASGVGPGLLAGLVLSVALALSRVANGTPLTGLHPGEWLSLGNGAFYYIAAGGAVGVVSRVLERSAAELRRANEEAVRQRERVARLAEHEAMGREIHDSVLQAIALVNKRGKELAAQQMVEGREVGELAEMAAEQATALRALIQGEPREAPPGMVPLRTVLQAAVYGVAGVPVTITTVGQIWFPPESAEGLSAAVRQALENVAQHAHASRATVFAEEEDESVVVAVRDDGVGFDYDEVLLRREGKMGMLKSMKGRIEELGGTVRISSAPGRGAEVEFRVPLRRRQHEH